MAVTDYVKIELTDTTGTVTRYYGYDETAMSCAGAESAARAMTKAQVLALPATAPVAPFRKIWRVTTCSGGAPTGTDVITGVVLGEVETDAPLGGGGGGGSATLESLAGPRLSYSGTISSKSEQRDTAWVNLAVADFTDGWVELSNTANPQPLAGRSFKYLINHTFWGAGFGGRKFNPEKTLVVQVFEVPDGAPEWEWATAANYRGFARLIFD